VAQPSTPPPPSPLTTSPLAPSPLAPPPLAQCGNFSVALGIPGADMAVLDDIPMHSVLHNAAREKCNNLHIHAIEWSSLDFCEDCDGPVGCEAFCTCILHHTQGKSLLDSCIGVRYSGHSTRATPNDGAWSSLLPISIVIFFGGFLCQMYIKSNGARMGGGLGGRGEDEGAELLCLPARRRKVPEDNERMVRRAASAHPPALSTLPPTTTLTARPVCPPADAQPQLWEAREWARTPDARFVRQRWPR
tara:strand:+ start:428 stop:1168 length:741 start_codon:yes stop_codon:yes gene_type:complete